MAKKKVVTKKKDSPQVAQQKKQFSKRHPPITKAVRSKAAKVLDKHASPRDAAHDALEDHTTGHTTSGEMADGIDLKTTGTEKPLGHGPDTIDFRVPNPWGIKATGTLTDAPADVPTVNPTRDKGMEIMTGYGGRPGVHDEIVMTKDQPGNILNIDAADTEKK